MAYVQVIANLYSVKTLWEKKKKNKGWAQSMPQKLFWLNMNYIHLSGLIYNAWPLCRSMEVLTVFNSFK